ncbi:MAG TPA: carbon starvation CstA family protein [Polyangium sp.]|nr:carbon starvation CstA family protein [Polyangium sp.]
MLPLLALGVIVVLTVGYFSYGRLIARNYTLDDASETPAVRRADGEDFVPTKPFYLLGQHFSAIAAAGPIAGPILAAQMFGWVPCVLWIGFGVIFIGAVHDFSALVASVRHDGESVAEIVRRQLGRRAWLLILTFIWLALIYVIVAFADITASTFVGKTEEFEGGTFSFNPGGAVAAASTMYLGLSVVMGLVDRRWKPPLWLTTIIFVPATLAVVWLGTKVSTSFVLPFENPQRAWGLGILVYCFIASLLPVWLLLQPRGYLGGFVLYLALAAGVIGLFFGGLRYPGEFDIRMPAFKTFDAGGPFGGLFPFLFVTIACGACSGFHGLVCSGTTSKQIAKESHTHPVGYGAMLLEAFVAIIALTTVITLAPEGKLPGPGKIYGDGVGRFMTVILGKEHFLFAATFGAMAFSTFVFDTLDVSTRLGRYVLEELFGWSKKRKAGAIAAALTLVPPAYFVATARPPGPGVRPAYLDFWTLFGTSNQLLAALTLLAVTVWLHREKRRIWYTAVPMVFVMTVTLWALIAQIRHAFGAIREGGFSLNTATMNGVVGVLLVGLAIALLIESSRALLGRTPAPAETRAG